MTRDHSMNPSGESAATGHHHQNYGDHGVSHEGHEQLFRRRFFVSALLSVSVLLYSPTLQDWLGFTVPAFP